MAKGQEYVRDKDDDGTYNPSINTNQIISDLYLKEILYAM